MKDIYTCTSCGATDKISDLQESDAAGFYLCNNCTDGIMRIGVSDEKHREILTKRRDKKGTPNG